MRCDNIENPRPLGMGDFFPDVVFESPDGTLHTASLGGLRFAILLFPPCKLPDGGEAAAARLLHAISRLVPVMLAGFPGNRSVPALAAGQYHELQSAIPECMLMGNDTTTPRLFVLERDGKISWVASVSDTENCLASVIDIIGNSDAPESEPFAPVLVVRNALSPEMCKMLIHTYEESDNKIEGGVGLSKPEYDPSRKRRGHVNMTPSLGQAIDDQLRFALFPMLERCFDFRTTRRVNYKVALYDALNQGFFYPHRDNSDAGTDYRRYALSLALNDDWDGDGLSFPEFGHRRYRADTGSAIVFPPSLMHQVHPVKAGKRYVLLSFLYAEEGARSRRAAMKDPGLLDSTYPDAIDPGLLRDYDEVFARERRFAPKYSIDGKTPLFIKTWSISSGALDGT